MRNRRYYHLVGLLVLGLVLAGGFYSVLERRVATGTLYPHYASFRSDPLGVSAFYETLDGLGEFEVSRNVAHLNSVRGLDADTSLLLLGYPRDGFQDLRAPEDSPVMKAVEEGARLVITVNPGLVPEKFRPQRTEEEDDWLERRRKIREERDRERAASGESSEDTEDVDEAGDSELSRDPDGEENEDEEEKKLQALMDEALGLRFERRLGFRLRSLEGFERPQEGWETEPGAGVTSLPEKFHPPAWFSPLRFEQLDESWIPVVYAWDASGEGGEGGVEKQPVVIERKWGKGTVVLASDSYFASNEALHLGGEAEFLLWLVGAYPRVVFDETIHGTRETGGAMKLMRRYRVHGVFFGLLLVVFLWGWRSASTLAPGSEDLDRGLVDAGGTVAGEEKSSGLIRLLRRSVPSDQLLEQCFQTWKASRVRILTGKEEAEISQLLDHHRADPKRAGLVSTYRAMVEKLRRR
jgi:hypothetical protein